MSSLNTIRNSFNRNSSNGLSAHHNGRLKAEKNTEFLQQYKKLLSENDRVLHMDIHSDQAGAEFIASSKHMSMLKSEGYEYYLIELPASLNDDIIAYEKNEIKIEEFKSRFMEESYQELIIAVPFLHDFIKEEEDVIKKGLIEAFTNEINAIINAQEYGIKVRFFDDHSNMGETLAAHDKNLHIDKERRRIDVHWDPYIEAITEGKKASLRVGSSHVESSYGIDEYLEARGYKIGTFRIKNEQSEWSSASDEEYDKECFITRSANKSLEEDSDGYDPSDFSPDLFYNEQTKNLITNAQEHASICSPDTTKEIKGIEKILR